MSFSLKTLILGRRWGHGQHNSLFGYLVDGLNAIGSLLIFAIMAMIVIDVLSRNLFNLPIAGVAELVAASIVMIVFLQLPGTLRHNRMAQADIFIAGFTEKHPRLGHLVQCVFFWRGLHALYRLYRHVAHLPTRLGAQPVHGRGGVFTFPVWPIRFVIISCAAITVAQYLLLSLQSLWLAWRGQVSLTEEVKQ